MAIAINLIISIFVSIFSVSIRFLCAASGEIKMFIVADAAVKQYYSSDGTTNNDSQ